MDLLNHGLVILGCCIKMSTPAPRGITIADNYNLLKLRSVAPRFHVKLILIIVTCVISVHDAFDVGVLLRSFASMPGQ